MKLFTATIAFAALLLASSASANDGAAQGWELKGQRLGMAKAESLALAPNAVCEEFAAGVEMCIDKASSFAGTSAHLVLKFLDGKLISVAANEFDWSAADAAGAGLVQKFGAPTREFAKVEHVADARENLSGMYRMWKQGNVALIVEPFDRGEDGKNYAAVKLTDTVTHDHVWLRRAQGQQVANTSDL